MARFDFPNTEPSSGFTIVEPGNYQMQIVGAKERWDDKNRCLWDVLFRCPMPQFDAKRAFYHIPEAIDSLRILLRACKLPYHGPVEVIPEQLMGLRLLVEVEVNEFISNKTGKTIRNMQPTFSGFFPLEEKQESTESGDPIPF